MGLPRLDGKTTTADDVARQLEEYGVVVIEGLVDSEAMETLRQDLDNVGGKFFGKPGSFAGSNTVRNAGKPLGESKVAQKLAENPLVLQVVRQRLSKWCRRVVLGTVSAIDVHPPTQDITQAQVLHRDEGMWGASEWPWLPHNETRPELSISVMWAVSDFTKDNGCTRFVPGSHRWERKETTAAHEVDDLSAPNNAVSMSYTRDEKELAKIEAMCEFAEMPQGSVVLWSGATLHGAGAHLLDDPTTRYGLLFIYNLGWLRSEQNFHWSMPPDVVARLPRSLQELIGYVGGNQAEHQWFSGPVYAQPLLG